MKLRLLIVSGLAGLSAACASSPSATRMAGSSPAGPIPQHARDLIAPSSGHQKIGQPYRISGRTYRPQREDSYDRVGIASWYGPNFHGRPTANGEVFDQDLMTAAHTTLPIPSIVEVTNLENGRSAVVRVNDRGPFVDDRIIDLSRAAATHLGYRGAGLARVRVRYLGPAYANAQPPAAGTSLMMAEAAPAPDPIPVAAPAEPPLPASLDYAQEMMTGEGLPPAEPVIQPVNPTEVAQLETSADPLNADLPALPPGSTEAVPVPAGQPGQSPAIMPTDNLTLQLAAFADPDNARQFAQRVADAGEVWVEEGTSSGRPIFRVYFGRWTSRDDAQSARRLIENWGVFDARLVDMN